MSLDTLVTQLRQAYGDALQAVVLYGSAASGEQVEGQSDLNVLVLARTISFDIMRALGQTVRAWQEAGHPPFLVLTTAEWLSSADVFPMEYADILERHRVLFGSLPLEGVQVKPADLRLQVEQEAMGKLLRLRRGVMAAGGDVTRQQELLRSSLSALLVIFRAVLRLDGVVPARDAEQVMDAVAARAGFDATPFRRVAALRRGTVLSATDTESVLEGYIRGVTTLVGFLDGYALPPVAG